MQKEKRRLVVGEIADLSSCESLEGSISHIMEWGFYTKGRREPEKDLKKKNDILLTVLKVHSDYCLENDLENGKIRNRESSRKLQKKLR